MIVGLPYDAEVEYLESTGTQWIDTGIPTNKDLEIDLVFGANGGSSSDAWGDWHGSDATAQRIFYNTLNLIRYDIGSRRITFNLGTAISLSPRHFRFSNFKVEDVTYGISEESTVVSSFNGEGYTFKLLHRAPWTTRVFRVILQLGGVSLWDGIPVRFTNEQNQSEGAMYDRVSRKLFRNAGTGAFVIGPDVATPVMGLHFMPRPKYTARDYVHMGLIAMWDGIENVGYGQHDDNATSWADLTGGGANWLLKDSHTPEVFEVGSDYVKILSAISYNGRGYCSPSWTSEDDLVSCDIVFDADNVDMTTIANARRVVGFMASGTGRSIWFQSGFISCGFNQYPCAAITQGAYSMSFDFGVQRAMLNGAFFESTRKGLGWISMLGPSISGYGYGDAYCAVGAKIKALRVYGRSLSDAERLANYAIDKVRFNLQ